MTLQRRDERIRNAADAIREALLLDGPMQQDWYGTAAEMALRAAGVAELIEENQQLRARLNASELPTKVSKPKRPGKHESELPSKPRSDVTTSNPAIREHKGGLPWPFPGARTSSIAASAQNLDLMDDPYRAPPENDERAIQRWWDDYIKKHGQRGGG